MTTKKHAYFLVGIIVLWLFLVTTHVNVHMLNEDGVVVEKTVTITNTFIPGKLEFKR